MNVDRLVENDPKINEINKKQKDELVEYGKKMGEMDTALPTSWIVNMIEGLFYIGWWQQKDEQYSSEEVAKLAFSSFSKGVSI